MSLSRDEIIRWENSQLADVYHRRNLAVVRGKDALIWDADGKQYIDCMAGFGAAFIGHCNEKVVKALQTQAEKLIACHGSLYSEARAQLLRKLASIAPKGLDKVFLSNSGSEAVELALKVSRKFTGKKEFIAMMRSYHGKTMGSLSVTWNAKYRAPFEPLIPQVKFVPYGRSEEVRKALTADTAAIIVEPVQGEGGVYVAPEGYLKELRELADRQGALLIFDEIQTGFGRTGKMFALEHWNVTPDILCLAKAAGSGVPIGITLAGEEVMGSLKIGEHSATFGGNPLSCIATVATIDVLVEGRLWEAAARLGKHFSSRLRELGERHRIVREVRGLGLMLGMELRFDVLDILNKMLEKGVLIMNAGVKTLRFLPPCVISPSQLDTVVEKLEECLREKEASIAR
ncbi:aspartate aminotransferase family protein [Candidatus Hecatella orcuttiae]|uniref:aspartate aminotransferase family protein n=1 Tax=Candidatus Hecatella orcuttiae TaxID=1935119 RepID=UPI002867D903|nr:aspartate aminotransferase family protein [Candidatus Hecatella orcuttiae]